VLNILHYIEQDIFTIREYLSEDTTNNLNKEDIKADIDFTSLEMPKRKGSRHEVRFWLSLIDSALVVIDCIFHEFPDYFDGDHTVSFLSSFKDRIEYIDTLLHPFSHWTEKGKFSNNNKMELKI